MSDKDCSAEKIKFLEGLESIRKPFIPNCMLYKIGKEQNGG